MFCPKCGIQNADNVAYCRNCGANLSDVMAVIEGKLPNHLPQSNEYNTLFSSGIRNLILGFGFALISILLFAMPGDTIFWLLWMIPAVSLLASGISRLVKASGMKTDIHERTIKRNTLPTSQSDRKLPPVQTDYIEFAKPISQTDRVYNQPPSITEPTTRQLQFDSEGETTRQLPEE